MRIFVILSISLMFQPGDNVQEYVLRLCSKQSHRLHAFINPKSRPAIHISRLYQIQTEQLELLVDNFLLIPIAVFVTSFLLPVQSSRCSYHHVLQRLLRSMHAKARCRSEGSLNACQFGSSYLLTLLISNLIKGFSTNN